jgi:hypothetical protein
MGEALRQRRSAMKIVVGRYAGSFGDGDSGGIDFAALV